jgi:hypothetical protein
VTTRAYLDESDSEPDGRRAGTYVIAAALIEDAELRQVDALLRALVRESDDQRRLHFSRIDERIRKRELAAVLGSLRGTRFAVAWAEGYTNTKDREYVRARILKMLLPHLAKVEGAAQIFIEQREDQKLRTADARVVGHLRQEHDILRDVVVHQVQGSTQPGLWLADTAAAAWRRKLVENHDNWSAWYAPHTVRLDRVDVSRRNR